jgi:hypothetical protein
MTETGGGFAQRLGAMVELAVMAGGGGYREWQIHADGGVEPGA